MDYIEKEFNVERFIEVTYSTSRISCEENGDDHDYQFESVNKCTQDFVKGKWVDLPESEWTYTKIMVCSICGDKEYVEISKYEYENKRIKTK